MRYTKKKAPVYLSNVTINIDKKYSMSYGSPVDVKYPLAKIVGNFIHLVDVNGFDDAKMNLTGKHFNSYSGKEIKELTFNNSKAKRYKDYLKSKNQRDQLAKIEAEQKSKIYDAEFKTAIAIVQKNKAEIRDFYEKNKKGRKGSLGSHQASTWMAFKLANKFKLSQTVLKNALKQVF